MDITHQQCVGAWLSVSEITLLSSCEPLDPVTQPSSSPLLLGTGFVRAHARACAFATHVRGSKHPHTEFGVFFL